MKAYVATKLFKNLTVSDNKNTKNKINVALENQSEGIIGMLPVFETKTKARKTFGRKVNLKEIKF